MPNSPPDALRAAGLAVFGGLTQAVLVAAWPRQRWQEQRRALARAYSWVAASARRLAADPETVLDPTPLLNLREAFTLTERQARRRPPAYRGLYGLPERIAMTLNALRVEAATPPVQEALLASADALAAIAEPGLGARAGAEFALRRVDDAVEALTGPVDKVGLASAGAGGRGVRPAFHRRRTHRPRRPSEGTWARGVRARRECRGPRPTLG